MLSNCTHRESQKIALGIVTDIDIADPWTFQEIRMVELGNHGAPHCGFSRVGVWVGRTGPGADEGPGSVDDGGSHTAPAEDLDMDNATFTPADLTTF